MYQRLWHISKIHGRRWHSSSTSSTQMMPLIQHMEGFQNRDCLVSRDGRWFQYGDILDRARVLAGNVLKATNKTKLDGDRIAYLCEPGDNYVVSKLATWEAGGCAVPLCITHPQAELEYVLNNAEVSVLITDSKHAQMAKSLVDKMPNLTLVEVESIDTHATKVSNRNWDGNANALIVYTSGTTGKPKGVVTRHQALDYQITDQISAWGWHENDRILNCLPLHHVHGIVNLTLVPMYSGACVEFIPPSAQSIWRRFHLGAMVGGPLTLFMAVPTIYSKLINEFDTMSKEDQAAATASAQDLRLMVSGSAALPTTVMQRWKEITGHTLLERYGMTEFCMGLTNPLEPVEKRYPGYVGNPMPSIQVRLVDEQNGQEIDPKSGIPGQLRVRGPGVFKEYWKRPDATAAEFDNENWFNTGDIAAYDPEKQSYRILGRASADIIKSGGYKISALEIERELLENQNIAEVAVLGVPDEYYGERVGAVIRWKGVTPFDEESFKNWCADRLAKYKIPSVYRIVDEIPKNAMGKVAKKALVKEVF